ncbi:hypothetical protein LX36DRAFT_659317 [Colletotrichum falcatum]|nr:hypothetical protein LX36DRAFT_659317 [Colletotrichum falcatum]
MHTYTTTYSTAATRYSVVYLLAPFPILVIATAVLGVCVSTSVAMAVAQRVPDSSGSTSYLVLYPYSVGIQAGVVSMCRPPVWVGSGDLSMEEIAAMSSSKRSHLQSLVKRPRCGSDVTPISRGCYVAQPAAATRHDSCRPRKSNFSLLP